ncbi:MAG TPA: hypothetical protein VGZ47_00590 [Gemmataceae bacterium]|nr:hypothetical protein [Gemmataceae bacterium]
MTESEWTYNDNAWEMLEFLNARCSERKFRLFGAWCCRRTWHLFTDTSSRLAVEVAERYVDRLATQIDLKQAKRQAELVVAAIERECESGFDMYLEGYLDWSEHHGWRCSLEVARAAAKIAQRGGVMATAQQVWSHLLSALGNDSDVSKTFRCNAADALRDIVGNPFCEKHLEPYWLEWRNGTIPRLASTIYEDQRFDLFPILSDALQEAGCTQREMLDHCTSKKMHVRGCWVVDLLLRKD